MYNYSYNQLQNANKKHTLQGFIGFEVMCQPPNFSRENPTKTTRRLWKEALRPLMKNILVLVVDQTSDPKAWWNLLMSKANREDLSLNRPKKKLQAFERKSQYFCWLKISNICLWNKKIEMSKGISMIHQGDQRYSVRYGRFLWSLDSFECPALVIIYFWSALTTTQKPKLLGVELPSFDTQVLVQVAIPLFFSINLLTAEPQPTMINQII